MTPPRMLRSAALPAAVSLLALAVEGCGTMQAARARLVRAPARCVDQTVQVYFEPDSAEVPKEGQAVIAAAADAARPCRVTGVNVLGLADSVGGDPASNLELSRRRARAVTAALGASHLPDATFEIAAAGQAGAVTPAGQAAPMRRRVDIVLHLAPR